MTRLDDAALIPIDIQQGFDDCFWGRRNNPRAEAEAARLIGAWRAAGRPIFHVRHASLNPRSPLHPAHPGFAFKPEAQPLEGEPQFVKSVNSGFIGTDLEARLRAAGIGKIIVFGLTTPHCVSTTVRMAANLGFDTYVAADACAAFDRSADFGWLGADAIVAEPETVHRFALANLHGEFATVLDTDTILKEAGHDPHRISPLPRPDAA